MARPPVGALGFTENILLNPSSRRLPEDRAFARTPEGRQMLREEQRRRSKEGTVMVEPVAHGKNPDGTDITDAQMRELIRHPTAGLFRDKGGAAWPMDQFTMRRIRDGDIKMMEDQDQTPKVSPPRRPPRSSSTSQE